MKTTLQKNGDVTIRIKKKNISNWRDIVTLFLEAYVDPDDLMNLTDEEKIMLTFDGQLVRVLTKMMKKNKKKAYKRIKR